MKYKLKLYQTPFSVLYSFRTQTSQHRYQKLLTMLFKIVQLTLGEDCIRYSYVFCVSWDDGSGVF